MNEDRLDMSIYEQFGVRPIINAAGTLSRLGGARMSSSVIEAMAEAARESVSMEELQSAASRVIAEATGAEAGLVTSGASAALTLGASAIMAGSDLGRLARLPDSTGMPSEFLVARDQRNGYDRAVRVAGGKLVEVGLNEVVSGAGVREVEVAEYEAALTPMTAGILYVFRKGGRPTLESVVAFARRHRLPVLVDAAAELDVPENLMGIPATGADLVAFSGGKSLGGPAGSGILCGKAELIHSAAFQSLDLDDHHDLWDPPLGWATRESWPAWPRHGVGRGFKVGRETVIGLMVALREFTEFASVDYSARWEGIRAALADLPISFYSIHDEDRSSATRWVQFDSIDVWEAAKRLRAQSPPVFLGTEMIHDGFLVIHLTTVEPSEDAALIDALRRLLVEGDTNEA